MSQPFCPRTHGRIATLAALALAGLPVAALAQVAPPPPPAAEPAAPYTPPPLLPPMKAPAAPPPRPQGQPVQSTNSVKPGVIQGGLPDLPYPPLWAPLGINAAEYNGPVVRYDQPLQYIALKHNPTVTPGMVDKIMLVVGRRRAQLEQRIIADVQTMVDVDLGLLQTVDIADLPTLKQVGDRIRPLLLQPTLGGDLARSQVFTKTQEGFQNKLLQEYTKKLGDEMRTQDADNGNSEFLRWMFEDTLLEAKLAYDNMLVESSTRMPKVLEGIEGLDAAAKQALLAVPSTEVEFVTDEPDRARAVKAAWGPLTTEQKAQFLKNVVATRANPDQPPLRQLDVTHPGKVIHVPEGEDKGIRMELMKPGERDPRLKDAVPVNQPQPTGG